MGHLGLEPRTIRLKAEYSTIELVTLMKLLYKIILNLTRLKINLRELGYLGLEPRTNRLKAEYSTIELVTHTNIVS